MTRDEEYKLHLNYVKGLTERRQAVSATYLTVNAAVTAAFAFLFKDGRLTGLIDEISALTLLVAGIVACGLWRRLINQYSTLIGWWYAYLRELETHMSDDISKPITKEYDTWYSAGKRKATIGITQYEVRLTWIFTTMYGLFSLGLIFVIATRLA